MWKDKINSLIIQKQQFSYTSPIWERLLWNNCFMLLCHLHCHATDEFLPLFLYSLVIIIVFVTLLYVVITYFFTSELLNLNRLRWSAFNPHFTLQLCITLDHIEYVIINGFGRQGQLIVVLSRRSRSLNFVIIYLILHHHALWYTRCFHY